LSELISALVVLASLAIWVISQIADAKKKQGQPPRQPAGRPAGPGDQPGMARAQPAAADPLRAQVDEFLRRAGQQGQPQAAQPIQPPQRAVRHDEIEVLVDEEAVAPARQPLAKPFRPMGEAAGAPRPIEPPGNRPLRRAAPLRSQSVAEHVAAHVDAAVEQIREEVSHLGEAVIAADREFDVQLQQKFDHKLGSLSARHASRMQDQRTAANTAAQVETPASQIAAMLASPDGVRQAIVINEILRRPEDRW
jgi:hypothetical protein